MGPRLVRGQGVCVSGIFCRKLSRCLLKTSTLQADMFLNRTPLVLRKPRPTPRARTVERSGTVEQDPVEVFCRIRPPEQEEQEECVTVVDHSSVKLSPPLASFAYRNGNGKELMYKFQQVFGPNSTQKDLFDRTTKPLVSDLLTGKNGLLFAYGVTGSGKTYTMEGTPQDGGIIRRTLDVVFNSINEYQAKRCIFKTDGMNGFDAQSESDAFSDRRRQDALSGNRAGRTRKTRQDPGGSNSNSQNNSQRIPDISRIDDIDEDNVFSIFVSYVEIYNNYIYDLLEYVQEVGPSRGLQTKIIREDAQHNMYVHSCTEVEVKSPEDALEVLHRGQKRRKIAYTRLNCESSRSHSIFTIRVVQAPLDAQGEEVVTEKENITVSQLSLVDLAGSERNVRTKAVGDRVKEAGNINNSLMNLRTCIEILRENQLTGGNRKVPYRDSRLTHYFKNYFDGEGSVKMVVCINPKADDYDETLTVMKFAELASEVQVQRCIQPRRDLGLPPGRRRANQLFKEVRNRLQEEGYNTKNEVVDLSPIYSLAPDWPAVSYCPDTMEEVITKLKTYLVKRIHNREKLNTDLKDKILSVRSHIAEMENKNLVLNSELRSIQTLYRDALGTIRNLQAHVLNAESANDSLLKQLNEYQCLRVECDAVREERDMAKVQGHLDKQRMKARLKTKLELEKERLKNDMNTKLTQQKSRIYRTQVKALKEMLLENDNKQTPRSSTESEPPAASATPGFRPRTNSDPSINTSQQQLGDLAGPAVVNLRHRRSRSQGCDKWVDHRPTQEVPTGTILKPTLTKNKSVTRVRSDDLAKSHAYCLTTQRQDSHGELETKLYKGNILPTAGGGTQVVFQDVEILQQRDPMAAPQTSPRKRSSDGTPKVDPSTLQDRCAVGIQHQTSTPNTPFSNKRSKM
ncbi:hypothetical protein Pcinc_018919 [Petrolisthes cinctipes]|uniref:Kinesin-like protein n=1 Tax=Petrolisthes cinctipes TaxID=88211 RepID=A0AAE1KIG1_PETCI|nr:hypothetical protein Pcinc_018919 [Petrolisthes cinctipes]